MYVPRRSRLSPIGRKQRLVPARNPGAVRRPPRARDVPRREADKTLIHNSLDERPYAVVCSRGIPSAEEKTVLKSSKQGSANWSRY